MNRPLRTLPADRTRSALLRALRPLAEPFTLIAASSRPWSSATFEGARHRLALALDGDDAAARAKRIEAILTETELTIADGFVADIIVDVQVKDGAPHLGIEALTIDDG